MKFQDKLSRLNAEIALEEIKEAHGAELDAQVERLMGVVREQKKKTMAQPTRVAVKRYVGRAAAARSGRYRPAANPLRVLTAEGTLDVVTLMDLKAAKKNGRAKKGSKAAARGLARAVRRNKGGGSKGPGRI